MAAFRSEGELDGWLRRHGWTRGAVVSPQTAYDLGREWYATRLDHAWERADRQTAAGILSRYGLEGPFWSLEE
ncbi:MAG: hypothetical protein IT180_12170 [Acidobacteria bacterium]|nr:hypothetical protein [Acidobacteriota bacterium]